MNLYVDRSIVKILDARAAENNTSRSHYVERLIRQSGSCTIPMPGDASLAVKDANSAKSEKIDKAKKAIVSRIPRKPRNVK